jgi:NDP-sugar pyrophosphorylase family protein
MKAIIFAAGLGTRLKPLTLHKPKALVEYKNKTLLQHAIEKLTDAGVTDIIVNVHHFGEQIIDFVNQQNFKANISISDERDELLDTGGGLKKAASFFDDDLFIAYNVDIISNIDLKEMINIHNQSIPLATLAVKRRKSSRKLLFNEKMQLCGWENQVTNEKIIGREEAFVQNFSFSGIHIIDPLIFKQMPAKNKFSIIELYLELSSKHSILGYIDKQDFWIDWGKVEQLNQ